MTIDTTWFETHWHSPPLAAAGGPAWNTWQLDRVHSSLDAAKASVLKAQKIQPYMNYQIREVTVVKTFRGKDTK